MTQPSTMKVARIRGGHSNQEWATICYQGWQGTGVDGQPRECGEILIHSSFGSWANSWSHLGQPFEEWLKEAEKEYCAGKFLGSKAYTFDGEKTVKELRASLLECRREGSLTKNDAKSLWDWVEESQLELECSADSFCNAMSRCFDEADWQDVMPGKYATTGPGRGARHFLQEPWERIVTSLDRSFNNFWEALWPVFVANLQSIAKPEGEKE